MNSKHEPQECKVCSKSFSSTVELLKHIAKEHNISEEESENITEIQDVDEVKMTKINKFQESVDNKERHKSFEFSESQFFDEFLQESLEVIRQNIEEQTYEIRRSDLYPGNG